MKSTTKDILENINKELSGSEKDLYRGNQRSLKYYVREINIDFSRWIAAKEREIDRQKYELTWALGLIGVIGIMLAITRSASSDWEWARDNTLTFRLCAVVLCTLFVGISLERSAVVRSLWSFTITKFLVSIIVSGLVLYARGKAAGHINEIFHVDASAFPITLIFTTAILVLKFLVPFVLAVAIFLFSVHIFTGVHWCWAKFKGKDTQLFPVYSLLTAFVSAVILYFGWGWSTNQLSNSRVPEKIYLMAYALDFSHWNECANVPPGQPIVFLGNDQESVLVAPHKLIDFDFSTFFEASVDVPTDFIRLRCDYKSGPKANELLY
jgi:hypothetical protein